VESSRNHLFIEKMSKVVPKNGSSDDVLQSQSPLELYNIWVCSSQNMDSKNVYCSAQIKLNTLVLGVFYSSVVS